MHLFKLPLINGSLVDDCVRIVCVVIGDDENEAPPIYKSNIWVYECLQSVLR